MVMTKSFIFKFKKLLNAKENPYILESNELVMLVSASVGLLINYSKRHLLLGVRWCGWVKGAVQVVDERA